MKYSDEYGKIIYGQKEYDILTIDYGATWDRLTKINAFTKDYIY